MIVFDASTLILLARIELLEDFLAGFGGEFSIPKKVETECCSGRRTLDSLIIQKVIDESKIQVRGVKDLRFVEKLARDFGLGRGEAEAIALAVQLGARVVAVDDKSGINACKLLGLGFTTAPAILVSCLEKKLLGRTEGLGKLSLLARFGRYKTSILEDVKSRLEATHD